jgi:hypothetical protein
MSTTSAQLWLIHSHGYCLRLSARSAVRACWIWPVAVPLFAQLDSIVRAELVEAVKEDTRKAVQHYRDGNELRFMMSTHIVVAHE